MVNLSKENLSINKVIVNKKEIINVEGEMIVPDIKPDIIKAISTSGIVSINKVDALDGKLRIDGGINTYIMYMPDVEEDNVRALNTTVDFSEILDIENLKSGMQIFLDTKINSIDTRVINERKIKINATIEVIIKGFEKEEIEIINDVNDDLDIQILKKDLKFNFLVGSGETRINGKDTILIEKESQFGEILKARVDITSKDVKVSYNKVLTKAEAVVKIIYLTEDNKIEEINHKIPIVGFIDIPEISEDNQIDINYELRNFIIKPEIQDKQSIYVDLDYEVVCNVYSEKNVNIIEDLYKSDRLFNVNHKKISTISDKMCISEKKTFQEKVDIEGIEIEKLIDSDLKIKIIKETKINTKILYELEAILNLMVLNKNSEIVTKKVNIPFEYVIDNLSFGETFNTFNEIDILDEDYIIKENGSINCNINLNIETQLYRIKEIELINEIEEGEERKNDEFSLVIYIVKKDDTLWKIAKEFGTTIDDIKNVNEIEDEDKIEIGQKLFIPKYVRKLENYG